MDRGTYSGVVLFCLAVISVLTALSGCCGSTSSDTSGPVIIVPDDYQTIQAAIDALPASGGTVYVRAGIYTVSDMVHIANSNVTVTADQGAVIRLASGVNKPVLQIGSTENSAPHISNVLVSGFEIDGNKAGQTNEISSPYEPWIRNNCINVRHVSSLKIMDVNLHDARSGGLVTYDTNSIEIKGLKSHSNYFDGLAMYQTDQAIVTDFFLNSNTFSGLSIDDLLTNTTFADGLVLDNGDNGIFARNSTGLSFNNVWIANNTGYGVYMSHAGGVGTGVANIIYSACSFVNNGKYGFNLDSSGTYSSNVYITGSFFSGNAWGAITNQPNATFYQSSNAMY